MDITIIIPAYNCQEELNSTLNRLNADASIHIIVVDDGSFVPLKVPANVQLIRSMHNKGVGTSFDIGVAKATTDAIILMGADVIPEDGWTCKAQDIITNHPMALTCAKCSGFTNKEAPFRQHRPVRYGAHILRKHERRFGSNVLADIIQAKWTPRVPEWEGDVGRVGCILGAFYMTTKTLYNNIGGWLGHKHWGGLEPMISLRAKRCGYPLFVARDLEAAHHFGRTTPQERAPKWPIYFYNKLLMAETMFENPANISSALYSRGSNNWIRRAEALILKDRQTGFLQDLRETHRQAWVNGLIKNNEEL